MKNGDETRTPADVRLELAELARQRAEKQAAVTAADRGIAAEALAVFPKEAGAEKRRKGDQAARTAALEELEHISLVETTLKTELEALERAEAEADRMQHGEEGKRQAAIWRVYFVLSMPSRRGR